MSDEIEEGSETSSLSGSKADTQVGPAIQVYRYLLEMFSDSLFLPHATVCLLDRDRLQFYHANHSVILVSTAINLLKDDGLDKLIAIIIASRWLSLEQNEIPDTLSMPTVELVNNPSDSRIRRVILKGNRLEFFLDRE